jgi:hypothetical protein
MDKMGKIDIDKFDTPSAHHGRWFLAGGRDRPASALHWDNSTYVHMYICTHMHTIEHNEVKGVHQGRCAVSQGRSGNDGHGTSSRQPGLQFQAWPVLTGLYCTVRSVNPPHSTSTSASLISLIFSNLSNLSNLFDVLALNHPIHNLHPSSLPPSPPSINPSIRRHISTSCSGSLPNLLNRPAELSPSSPPSADPSDSPAGATVARNLPQPHRPEPETARSGSCQHGSAVWLRSTAGCRRSAVIAGAVLGPPRHSSGPVLRSGVRPV